MASRKKAVAPVRAIFHDVVPAERRDVPSWMRKPAPGQLASSLPPHTAAALLNQRNEPRAANANHRPADPQSAARMPEAPRRAPSPSNPAPDPMLDARMKSASLAAEVSESWTPAAGGAAIDERAVVDSALTELRLAIVDLQQQQTTLMQQLEPQVLRLTRLIAERVLETEALKDQELPLRLVREGLSCLDHGGKVSVMLGSAFAHAAEGFAGQLQAEGISCDVQVIHQLSPFACRVKAEYGAVDESLETRLDNILASFLEPEE